jgi:hypothetical protein
VVLRAVIFVVGLMIAASGTTQHLGEVVIEVDEFTGKRTCAQFVAANQTDRTGVHMYVTDDDYGVSIWRGLDARAAFGDAAFNGFGKLPGDRVYFRFLDGRVIEVEPDDTQNNFDMTYPTEMAHIFFNRQLIGDLLTSPGDVSVRFSGPNGQGDFTLPHAVFVALARGFQVSCSY